MPDRTDNDLKNHWNSCLKKRLMRKGLDPVTHEPIIDLTAQIETKGPSSSSSSAGLLNKLAACISSKQYDLDRIKNIIFDPKITSSDQEEEEALKKDERNQEDEILKWEVELEQMSRLMENDLPESETTSLYDCFSFFESTLSPPYSIFDEDNILDYLD